MVGRAFMPAIAVRQTCAELAIKRLRGHKCPPYGMGGGYARFAEWVIGMHDLRFGCDGYARFVVCV